MTDVIRKLTPAETKLQALAPIMQRWSELCKQQVKTDPTPTLRWYLIGRADAHAMDAHRIREALSTTTTINPPNEGIGFVHAYESLLQMMHAMIQQPATPTPDDA